ncbi:MAG: M48 family metallopeptidase [Clostridia bacterium]|nr:M48 family metallopeptidase [Clostridia bacterium]
MSIDSKYYQHSSDKAALKTLKAVPGFSKVMKYFIDSTFERQFRIENMSGNVRADEKQLSEYYYMLPPICEKLGIDIPELYVDLDPAPNAYTYGDTNPFIVVTTGLLESMPNELIPSVLAHECGHIACHHTLYTTMGRIILKSSSQFLNSMPFGAFVSLSMQIAFFHWMRCSEYSADRAAAICDGNDENMIEVCMRLAGYRNGLEANANKQEFINQAIEYKEMINNSKINKAFEFFMLLDKDHPLTAVRAYEVREWVKSDIFRKIIDSTIDEDDINDDFEKQESGSNISTALKISSLKKQLEEGSISIEKYREEINRLLKK